MKDVVVLFKGRPMADPRSTLIPLQLISLAPPLIDSGFQVKIVDQFDSVEDAFKQIADELENTVCVGVSAVTGHEIADGVEFARRVKRAIDVPVVWGGWHPTILPGETVRHNYVDIVVKGAAQNTFLKLVQSIASENDLSSVNNIVYKKDGQIVETPNELPNLSECGLPAFNMLDLEYYRKCSLPLRHKANIGGNEITGYLYYVTSFGCPNRCAYCCSRSVFGTKMHNYDIVKVVEQIRWLVNDKKFNSIGFMDANFFINHKRVELFCKLIIENDIQFFWDAQMYVRDILRYEKKGLMELVKKAGCFRVNVGAESGSSEVLEYMQKSISMGHILESARILNKHNIDAAYNFLFGLPKVENEKHLRESFVLARELKKINPEFCFPVSFYVPFPGTPMYKDAIDSGFGAPTNLEDWGDFDTSYDTASETYPWKSQSKEKLIYNAMTFYLPLAYPGNIRRGTISMLKDKMRHSKFRLLIKIGSWLARQRARISLYRMPFEVWLFNLYRKIKGIRQYNSGAEV